MEYHKHYNLAYQFANAAPYTKGRFVGHTPFISRAKAHARILLVKYGEPVVFRFHNTDILVVYPDGRFNVNYGTAGVPAVREAMACAAALCGFALETRTVYNKDAGYNAIFVGEHFSARKSYRVARGEMGFDNKFNLLTQEGPLPEIVTNQEKLVNLRASLEPFMIFAALVFETAQGNVGYVNPVNAVLIAQDASRADEWEALVAYLKRCSVGYDRWGKPKWKCTLAIFKSFIAKTTLKMCKEKNWVQS